MMAIRRPTLVAVSARSFWAADGVNCASATGWSLASKPSSALAILSLSNGLSAVTVRVS
jgi:hypothetical protein